MKNKQRLLMFFSLLAVVLFLVGCGTEDTTQEEVSSDTEEVALDSEEESTIEESGTTFGLEPFEETQLLRVGFFSGSPHSMPWYIAEQEGFWEELNIEIEYVPFINGPAMMEASSNWDLASVGAPGVLVGQLGHQLKMIGAVDYEKNLALFVREDSPLLEDKAAYQDTTWLYPVGTSLHMNLINALEQNGLTENDITSINMDVTSALTAFRGGEGDGLAVWNAIAFAAEDSGFVRIEDSETLGVTNLISMMATDEALEEKRDLVTTAWMMYYLAWEWANESPENMEAAYNYYLESSENEGILISEDVAVKSMDYFAAPTPSEAVSTMINTIEDEEYTEREILESERDLLITMDFFISQGRYETSQRNKVLDEELVDSSIAIEAAEVLKSLGYIE